MSEYVFFERGDSGIVTRHGGARMDTSKKALEKNGYVYRELLTGWAESKVYWDKETGFASGWAPLRKK